MEAQRAHLTGSMKVYGKVAEYNAETLSSGDYSNIFPSQSGHLETTTDEIIFYTFGKDERDEAESEHSEVSEPDDVSEDDNFGCDDDYKEDEDEDTHPKIDKKAFRKAHESIPESSKMRLGTGKIVEDILFDFCKDMDYEQRYLLKLNGRN